MRYDVKELLESTTPRDVGPLDLEAVGRQARGLRRRRRAVAAGGGGLLVAVVAVAVSQVVAAPVDPPMIGEVDEEAVEATSDAGGDDLDWAVGSCDTVADDYPEFAGDSPAQGLTEIVMIDRVRLLAASDRLLLCVDSAFDEGGYSVHDAPLSRAFDPDRDVLTVDICCGGSTTYLEGPLEGRTEGHSKWAGRAADEVARVVLVRRDGSEVEAMVHEGYWVAWWPTDDWALTDIRAYDEHDRLLLSRPPDQD